MSIYMSGVVVDNRGKEKTLRAEIEAQRLKIEQLELILKAKYAEVEMLVEKIHKMGGRIKK